MFVLLGSNIEPSAHLERALGELRTRFEVSAVSPVYRTAPVGDSDQPDFWNVAVELRDDRDPAEVQRVLHAIEDLLGRRRDPARPSGPRTADLDLVFVEGAAGRFADLDLPSPLLERHAFVAVPVADLAPRLVHPLLGVPLATLAARTVAQAGAPPQRLAVELVP